MDKNVLNRVFKMVSETREENEFCENIAERTPFTPISPFEMQEILNQAKATGEDTYKILSFAISVVGGLLDFEDSVYKLNCTDRAQLIVQVEYLKTLIND